MPTFPLPFRPKQNYRKGGLRFGADRDGGARKHAGCDLLAPKGTEIYAVETGEVVRGPYPFYHGTDAIEFKLKSSGRIVRYSEIGSAAAGVAIGTTVQEGSVIAYVGKMYKSSMLHFEMYEGTASGHLTNRSNPPFQRRKDLFDPGDYLDNCTLWNVLAGQRALDSIEQSIQDWVKGVLPTRWIL